ncbi:MAG: efflux RND transporter periplasmic adaptor subunit [Bacteroidetes bacterium]|nr:MAG: efflux RND transporter periplasmic adaptor subunit [Bacteroidota bacterium]
MKIALQTAFLLFAGALFFGGCSEAESKSPETAAHGPKVVKTAEVKALDYREEVFATGKLGDSEQMKLSFKTGGLIKRIYVREGQTVRKGKRLADLDLEEIKARSTQASIGVTASEITIKNAELALERAERELRNVEGLYRDSVATYEQLHDARLQYQNAKNQLESARMGLRASRQDQNVAGFNLRHSRIVAPANGTILKKLSEVNEMVGPGQPVFLFGSKDKAKVIRVQLTDRDIVFVRLGDEAIIEFDAFPDQTFSGLVTEIASMADPYTNTFEVEIEVQSESENLRSGFIGQVRILTSAHEYVMEIPIDALIAGDRKDAEVFVVENQTAQKRKVHVYKIKEDKLLIDEGLKPGEQVVILGGGYLENGDTVAIAGN